MHDINHQTLDEKTIIFNTQKLLLVMDIVWHTDFNPADRFCRNCEVSGNGARAVGTIVQDFCTRSDLPDFDFIALHGIWSWISPSRAHIADFLATQAPAGRRAVHQLQRRRAGRRWRESAT